MQRSFLARLHSFHILNSLAATCRKDRGTFRLSPDSCPAQEAFEHLDALRQIVEKSTFHVRGSDRRAEKSAEKRSDRRAVELDRRKSARKKAAAARRSDQGDLFPQPASPPPDHLSVTVSIGVAEPSTRNRQPEQVIQSADQALYRAKNKGRNRVELASTAPLRLAEGKRAKASRL